MNRRIVRFGLVAVAVAVVVAIGLNLRPASNSGAQVTSSPTPSSSAGEVTHTPGSMGSLAYELDGDIYVANWDGSNPVRIANGVFDRGGGGPGTPGTYWAEGPIWSPNGRYLAYRGSTGDGASLHGRVFISDPKGRRVTSFPGEGWLISWSPDSTRVAVWVRDGRTIGIYGLDGVRQKLLTLPRGLMAPGDFDPVWSPDGASLLVPRGVEIPLDGSTPRHLPANDPRSHWQVWYSPDGARVAYVDQSLRLVVAAADGSRARVLVPNPNGVWVGNAAWSPTGNRIAFDAQTVPETTAIGSPATELRVVDVATGAVTSLTAGGASDQVIKFSPDGDRILFSRTNTNSVSSLWSINADGSDPQLLVNGTGTGDWQPLSAKGSAGPPGILPLLSEGAPGVSSSTAAPAYLPDHWVKNGPLNPGTHTYRPKKNSFNVRFTVPAGWSWHGRYLSKGGIGLPDGAAIFFFSAPLQVYADPVHWLGAKSTRWIGYPAEDFVSALAAQPSRNATKPTYLAAGAIGSPNRWPGMAVEVTVPDNLNLAACDRGQFRSWGPDGEARIAQGPGQRDLVWAIDTGGGADFGAPAQQGLVIDAATFPGTPASVISEIVAILKSIVVGHWG